jgi:hypothetical protein
VRNESLAASYRLKTAREVHDGYAYNYRHMSIEYGRDEMLR